MGDSVCESCGARLAEGHRFCGTCGAEAGATRPAVAEPLSPDAVAVAEKAPARPRRRSALLSLFLVAVILASAYAAVSWWAVPRLTAADAAVAYLDSFLVAPRDADLDRLTRDVRGELQAEEYLAATAAARHELDTRGYEQVSLDGQIRFDRTAQASVAGHVNGIATRIPLEVAQRDGGLACTLELNGPETPTVEIEALMVREGLSWRVSRLSVDGDDVFSAGGRR